MVKLLDFQFVILAVTVLKIAKDLNEISLIRKKFFHNC